MCRAACAITLLLVVACADSHSIGKLGLAGDCTPTSCAVQNKTCGPIPDACGNIINCGTCAQGMTCGDDNTCVCSPESNADFCARQALNCGEVTAADNCGTMRTISCGGCVAPLACSAGNVCVCTGETDAQLCALLGVCGTPTTNDRCGVMRTPTCSCPGNQSCAGSSCICSSSDATECSLAHKNCGIVAVLDSCGLGRNVACGNCSAGQTCAGDNTCIPSDGGDCSAMWAFGTTGPTANVSVGGEWDGAQGISDDGLTILFLEGISAGYCFPNVNLYIGDSATPPPSASYNKVVVAASGMPGFGAQLGTAMFGRQTILMQTANQKSLGQMTRPSTSSYTFTAYDQTLYASVNALVASVAGSTLGGIAPTQDGLNLYFQLSGASGQTVYVATRSATNVAFGTPAPLAGGVAQTTGPTLSSVSNDQRTLLFAFNYQLCYARRVDSTAVFAPVECNGAISTFVPRLFNNCKGIMSNHSGGGCINEDLTFYTRP